VSISSRPSLIDKHVPAASDRVFLLVDHELVIQSPTVVWIPSIACIGAHNPSPERKRVSYSSEGGLDLSFSEVIEFV